MKKWVMLSLFAIFIIASLIRLAPLTQFAVWGSDSGEYYFLTESLVDEGHVSTDYDGWGFAYPYFPGMFYISGAAHLLTGLDILWTLLVLIPIVASFSVLLIFFFTRKLLKSDRAGILAGAFVAVAMPHVFATSHPMPGSVGDVLLISSLILILGTLHNKRFLPLLLLNAMALTIVHHLSSYFLFIAAFGGLFLLEITRKEGKEDTKSIWAFLFVFLTILVLYWSIYAEPFSKDVVSDVFPLPPIAVFLAGYAILILAYILIKLRRRSGWSFEPRYPKPNLQFIKYFTWLILIFLGLFFMTQTTLIGTDIKLDMVSVLLFSPLIIVAAMGSIGSGYLSSIKNGMFVYGWILAILLSLLLATATSNLVLLPYRHAQYLMVPLGLFIGLGIVMMFRSFNITLSKQLLAAWIIIVLLALTSSSAYPPKEIMGGFQEGTSEADTQGVVWVENSVGSDSLIATDHRMSSMVFGFGGIDATWDSARKTLHAPSYEECREEIESINAPSGKRPVDYILLDDDIKEGVALLQWENAEPMSKEAQEKFAKAPFIKLYEANGVEVYGIVK